MSAHPLSFPGWPTVLSALVEHRDLSPEVAAGALDQILHGDATPSQISAFIVALKSKGESTAELSAMLQVVRNNGVPVVLADSVARSAIDIVGTGGDHSNSVNVSTMSALVVAGAGVPVCKHGNRAASSKCGAADVLEALGVAIELDAQGVQACIEETGMGFCFAPRFHPAFRHAGPTRREIGIATVFNVLGPLANPAPIANMLVGVANVAMARRMAETLATRGVTHAWIVHGHGGLDELSLSGTNDVVELRDGEVSTFTVVANDLGLTSATPAEIEGGDSTTNANVVKVTLSGQPGPVRDIVLLNSAAALVVCGAATDLRSALPMCGQSIDSGAAASVLDALVHVSNRESQRMAEVSS